MPALVEDHQGTVRFEQEVEDDISTDDEEEGGDVKVVLPSPKKEPNPRSRRRSASANCPCAGSNEIVINQSLSITWHAPDLK